MGLNSQKIVRKGSRSETAFDALRNCLMQGKLQAYCQVALIPSSVLSTLVAGPQSHGTIKPQFAYIESGIHNVHCDEDER